MNEITNAIPQITALVDQGGVTPQQVEHIAQDLVGQYGWFILGALGAILAKDMIINFAQALLVFMGNDFNNDDIIYISGRQARIVRVGVRTTCFYMTDRASKMVVPNEQLKQLTIEKGTEEIPVYPSPMEVKVVDGDKPPPKAPTRKR